MQLDVIIPVGPGHEGAVKMAAQSVEIAKDYDTGIFTTVRVLAVGDTDGEMGRSAARNFGVRDSRADWVFFLDADDIMLPAAIRHFSAFGVLADAVWGQTMELSEGGLLLERYQVPEIDSYKKLIRYDPSLTVKMGHFVRRDIAKRVPFDEDMDCGEDWDYYLRIWKQFDCRKIDAPFFAKIRGNHSTGPRSATGRQWNEVTDRLIAQARLAA